MRLGQGVLAQSISGLRLVGYDEVVFMAEKPAHMQIENA
jgi:hypothetical protein